MSVLNHHDLFTWSLAEFERLGCTELLSSDLIQRVRERLGGSHTVVTYPPLDALTPGRAGEVLERVHPVNRLDVYAHIAFCEFLCPFCHYDTAFSKIGAGESEKTRRYMDALHSELAGWRARLDGSTVSSLYIGGGTPTSVSEHHLVRVLETVFELPRTSDFLACVETSPLTVVATGGAAKLRTLADAGVSRFSIGVQSFNPNILRRSRGHGLEVVLRALELVLSVSQDVNIDMIQDLPGQTVDHLIDDLEQIANFRPQQVTWYVLRLRREAAWYRFYDRSALDLPDTAESLRRRILINEGMRRLGYNLLPGGRFVLPGHGRDRFKDIRAGLTSALLGVGVSAYSHGWGTMFRNTCSRDGYDGIGGYIDRINTQGVAVEDVYDIDDVELAASAVVTGIRDRLDVPRATAATENYLNEVRSELDVLIGAGLVEELEDEQFSLSDLGRLFEEEICTFFYTSKTRAALRQDDAFWRDSLSSTNSIGPTGRTSALSRKPAPQRNGLPVLRKVSG